MPERISNALAQSSEARPGVSSAVESHTADEKGLASRVEELENLIAKHSLTPELSSTQRDTGSEKK